MPVASAREWQGTGFILWNLNIWSNNNRYANPANTELRCLLYILDDCNNRMFSLGSVYIINVSFSYQTSYQTLLIKHWSKENTLYFSLIVYQRSLEEPLRALNFDPYLLLNMFWQGVHMSIYLLSLLGVYCIEGWEWVDILKWNQESLHNLYYFVILLQGRRYFRWTRIPDKQCYWTTCRKGN